MNAKKVSIIIPVYKAERYLRECVDSILGQTATDFELILIDDGSPDNSGAICDEYAARDARIRVFHQKNAGVAKTRERGIELAQGKYIFWVDADDYVDQKLLEKVLLRFDETGSDIVTYGHADLIGKRIVEKPLNDQSLAEWQRDTLCGKMGVIWNFASRRELWNRENYPTEVRQAAEDGYMAIRIFLKAQRITTLPDILYYYRNDNGDSVSHKPSAPYYLGNAWLWHYRMQSCKKQYSDLIDLCASRAFSAAVKSFCLTQITADLSEEEISLLLRIMQDSKAAGISGRWRDQILYWSIRHQYWELCRQYARHKLSKGNTK